MRAQIVLVAIGLALLAGCVSASPSATATASAEPIAQEACPTVDLRTPSGDRIDLTGRWRARDGGTYYLRQSNSCVWFSGLSPGTGSPGGVASTAWTNAFFGHVRSDFTLRGSWADLPWGRDVGVGLLNLRIDFAEVNGREAASLTVIEATGGFGGDFLLEPESDVDLRLELRDTDWCIFGVSDDGTEYALILVEPGWAFAEPARLLGPSGEEILPSDPFEVIGELARGAEPCGQGLVIFADDIRAITTP